MSRRSRAFAVQSTVASLLLPGALIALAPIAEPQSTLGVVVGWGLALLAIVPSFAFMARVVEGDDQGRFQRVFMGTTTARFGLTILGVLAFALLVPEPPLKTFLLSYFLGFAVLSGIELTALLSKSPDGTHA